MAPAALTEPRCSAALRLGLESGIPDAVHAALDDLGAPPTLAIIEVCAPGDPDTAGRALVHASTLLSEAAPDCVVIGSNAHGVVGPVSLRSDAQVTGSVELRPAVSVWLTHMHDIRPRAFRLATVPAPYGGVALTGLPDIAEDDGLAMLLADPWTLPADDAVSAFTRVDGTLPVIGGLVSGAQRRGESRLLLNGSVFDNGGVGVLMPAAAPLRVVVSQGCRPIGEPMTVTGADGVVLQELAGRPALERVREVVSALDAADQALAVRGLHVGIARSDHIEGTHAADYVIRGLMGVDAQSGAVTVGDEVSVGAVVRLHLRDADSADADLRSVVALAGECTDPVGAYLVTCNGRGGAMFTTPDHDGAVVREGLGLGALGGFFAAGEIGPVGGSNHLHGFTAVIVVVDRNASGPDVPVEIHRATAAVTPTTDLDDELRALLDPP